MTISAAYVRFFGPFAHNRQSVTRSTSDLYLEYRRNIKFRFRPKSSQCANSTVPRRIFNRPSARYRHRQSWDSSTSDLSTVRGRGRHRHETLTNTSFKLIISRFPSFSKIFMLRRPALFVLFIAFCISMCMANAFYRSSVTYLESVIWCAREAWQGGIPRVLTRTM